jgi:hypothetical protein
LNVARGINRARGAPSQPLFARFDAAGDGTIY